MNQSPWEQDPEISIFTNFPGVSKTLVSAYLKFIILKRQYIVDLKNIVTEATISRLKSLLCHYFCDMNMLLKLSGSVSTDALFDGLKGKLPIHDLVMLSEFLFHIYRGDQRMNDPKVR